MPSSSSDFFLSCSNRSPWWRLRIYVSHFSVVPNNSSSVSTDKVLFFLEQLCSEHCKRNEA